MTNAAANLADALAFHQGDWMKKALDAAGVSSKAMAEYLDVEPATVSRWLNGKRTPSKQTIRLWALRTGVPMRYLETGSLNDEAPQPDGPTEGRGTGSKRPESGTPLYHLPRVVHVDFAASKKAAA